MYWLYPICSVAKKQKKKKIKIKKEETTLVDILHLSIEKNILITFRFYLILLSCDSRDKGKQTFGLRARPACLGFFEIFKKKVFCTQVAT